MVDIVIKLRVGQSMTHGLIPDRSERVFSFSETSRPPVGSTHPPVQWVRRPVSLK